MRFGGYTEQMWNNSNKNNCVVRKDGKGICFCYSLDLFKIYNFNENHKNSINCYYSYGPFFSGCDNTFFCVYNNNDLLFGFTNYTTKLNSFGKFDNNYEINNGQSKFSVIEMEVFQILFDD